MHPIADDTSLPELTLRGLVLGALITVLFTGSNVYLGLKVGLTFASSIPAAVISMAVLRLFARTNILENNMVQTQASAAGTLSAIIFIVPGLVMIGHWQGFPFWQTAGICAIGGVLGVMYTIPLRRAMVVESDLPYPEGVAAAEILLVGSEARTDAAPGEPGLADIIGGGAVAAAFSLATGGFGLLADEASWWFQTGAGAVFRLGTGFSLALLGAGYLVGIVAGLAMLLGLVIAWGVAVPMLTTLAPPPSGADIAHYATGIWSHQVRFIGAGAIAVGAVWTLLILLKPMLAGIRASLAALRDIRAGRGNAIPRTERDMPIHLVAAISLALAAPMAALFVWFLPPMATGLLVELTAVAILFTFVFGFLIAAACGYMAGIVGSTNSPISGIGIVAVTLVSLLLLAILGNNAGAFGTGIAIFITSVIVAIAAIANDNLQDLKTGRLVGATPWKQQVALIAGVAVGALVIPPILQLLYTAYGFPGALPHPGMDPAQALSAPQATLMSAIATGIFSHALDWTMMEIGAALGLALVAIDEALRHRGGKARLPVLAVGIGIYLPPGISTTLVIGAVLGWLIDRSLRARKLDPDRPRRRGVLFASGMIVGESLIGVALAAIIGLTGSQAPLALVGPGFAGTATWLALLAFTTVCIGFYRHILKSDSPSP